MRQDRKCKESIVFCWEDRDNSYFSAYTRQLLLNSPLLMSNTMSMHTHKCSLCRDLGPLLLLPTWRWPIHPCRRTALDSWTTWGPFQVRCSCWAMQELRTSLRVPGVEKSSISLLNMIPVLDPRHLDPKLHGSKTADQCTIKTLKFWPDQNWKTQILLWHRSKLINVFSLPNQTSALPTQYPDCSLGVLRLHPNATQLYALFLLLINSSEGGHSSAFVCCLLVSAGPKWCKPAISAGKLFPPTVYIGRLNHHRADKGKKILV